MPASVRVVAFLERLVGLPACPPPASLLTDKTGLTAHNGGIVVINKPEHQLPLFVITLSTSTGQQQLGYGGECVSA